MTQPALVKEYRHQDEDAGGDSRKRKLLQLPAVFNKSSVHLAKMTMVAALSSFLSSLTNGTIHYFIVALLLGIVFSQLGFLEKNAMNHTASSGFIVFATTVIIFSNLALTTPQQMLSMIFSLVLCLGIGVIATGIAGTVLGKVLKVSPRLAIFLGLTCTGLPGKKNSARSAASRLTSGPIFRWARYP